MTRNAKLRSNRTRLVGINEIQQNKVTAKACANNPMLMNTKVFS